MDAAEHLSGRLPWEAQVQVTDGTSYGCPVPTCDYQPQDVQRTTHCI